MNTLQQIIEREYFSLRNYDFPIQNELFGLQGTDCRDKFGKIPRQRLTGFRLQFDLAAVPKNETAKAVPFRFILPVLSLRDLVHGEGFHRRKRLAKREGHPVPNAKRPALGRPFENLYWRRLQTAPLIHWCSFCFGAAPT